MEMKIKITTSITGDKENVKMSLIQNYKHTEINCNHISINLGTLCEILVLNPKKGRSYQKPVHNCIARYASTNKPNKRSVSG